MSKKIARFIRKREYEKAYLMMQSLALKEKWEILSADLYDEDPKTIYTFLLYMIAIDGNEAEWQYYCTLYLVYCNPFFDDTMRLASWHIKQAIRLDPKNTKYKKQVTSVFYSFPEKYFSNEEYYRYAEDVLKENRNDDDAQRIILSKP